MSTVLSCAGSVESVSIEGGTYPVCSVAWSMVEMPSPASPPELADSLSLAWLVVLAWASVWGIRRLWFSRSPRGADS